MRGKERKRVLGEKKSNKKRLERVEKCNEKLQKQVRKGERIVERINDMFKGGKDKFLKRIVMMSYRNKREEQEK